MTTRKITNIQFSEGVVIAGDQLDAAWADVQRRFAALMLSDVERKWFETQLVYGYQPRRVDWEPTGLGFGHPRENPWMPGLIFQVDPPVSQFKGFDFPSISPPNTGSTYVWGFGWTTGTDVQVITAVDLCLAADQETDVYPRGWDWTANMPTGISAGDFVEDCGLEIVIDHPTSPGDPDSTSVLVYKAGVSVDSQYQAQAPAFANDILPAYPAGAGFEGVWFHADGLHLPVPANARVRVFLVLPNYVNSVSAAGVPIVSGDVRWRTPVEAPYALQEYSGSVTILLPRGGI
jgi:hypothetical protein